MNVQFFVCFSLLGIGTSKRQKTNCTPSMSITHKNAGSMFDESRFEYLCHMWYYLGYAVREEEVIHDDVIKWKHFPRYWPFVLRIHRSSVNSPHKNQWHGALMLSLICVWINGWVNNREAGDLRRHCAHYDVTVMIIRVLINYTYTRSNHACRIEQIPLPPINNRCSMNRKMTFIYLKKRENYRRRTDIEHDLRKLCHRVKSLTLLTVYEFIMACEWWAYVRNIHHSIIDVKIHNANRQKWRQSNTCLVHSRKYLRGLIAI